MIGVALLWLIVLELFSLAAFPIAYRAFSHMPDRGWAFSKPLGLLFVGIGTWVIGLTHTIPNSRWSVLLALLLVAAVSLFASRNNRDEIWTWAKRNASTISSIELLFMAALFGMALLRGLNGNIDATEEPMDLMFLNAVVTSTHYPPIDPWMAGEPVSYYYFGYLMIGAVSMFAGIATPIAYNLGLATAAAMAVVAAFGLTYNLVRLARGSEDGAVFAGIGSAFLLILASNLVGTLGLLRAAGVGDVGFWEAIDINGLSAPAAPAADWRPDDSFVRWNVSRVVPGGHINEFPLFSFIIGDLHPHVMSIGFVLLMVGVSVQLYLQPGLLRFGSTLLGLPLTLILAAASLVLVSFLFLGVDLLWLMPVVVLLSASLLAGLWPLAITAFLSAGTLAAINLWDLPLGVALVSGAVLLNAARNERSFGFASAVAIHGDVMIAGAPNDSMVEPGSGSALVFARQRDRWRKASFLRPAPGSLQARFGTSVDAYARHLIVGAPGISQAFVYEEIGDTWRHRATLRPPEGQHLHDFGRRVAIRTGTAAVSSEGAVFVFDHCPDGWTLQAKLVTGTARDDFGASLDLTDDALAVGAPGSLSVYRFKREHGTWHLDDRILRDGPPRFGQSVSADTDRLLIGGEGEAHLYHHHPAGWAHEATLTPTRQSPGFGRSVALDRWLAVVGAEGGSTSRSVGSVDVFADQGGEWEPHAHLVAADVASDSQFGAAVAISTNTVAAGAPGRGQGASYLFRRDLDQWTMVSKLTARWRLLPAAVALGVLISGMLAAMAPFWTTFDGNSAGVLPLLSLTTRPLHLFLLWGTAALLTLPMLVLAVRSTFGRGSLNLKRLGISAFVAFTPVMFWLQPIYAFPLFAVAVGVYALHQAGYRMPSADETTFAYNPRLTLWVGGSAVALGFIWDGIFTAERGIGGELLAVDRMLVVVPIAVIATLAIYGAWTFAHRDSEVLRTNPGRASLLTSGDALTPALGLLSVGATLIMGVELFHVVDIFGGDLRRMNTMFKLHYQAWLLMSVMGGFAMWYVTSKLNRRRLGGRLGTVVWTAALLFGLGAVSYYPLAAVDSVSRHSSALQIDGQAHLATSAPGEYAAIQWIKENVPRDAVIAESAVSPCPGNPSGCHSYTAAARMSGSTGRQAIIGWLGHERQWRSSDTHAELDTRFNDVRVLYTTTDLAVALDIIERYDVSYVVVGEREQRSYGFAGMRKFEALGEQVFASPGSFDAVTIYRLNERDAS